MEGYIAVVLMCGGLIYCVAVIAWLVSDAVYTIRDNEKKDD